MPGVATALPCRRPELVIRPLGDRGPYVVKDPRTGAYYQLGDEEHFLLTQLDGRRDEATVRKAFAQRFGQPLADDELGDFLEMMQDQGLLGTGQPDRPADNPAAPATAPLGPRLLS